MHEGVSRGFVKLGSSRCRESSSEISFPIKLTLFWDKVKFTSYTLMVEISPPLEKVKSSSLLSFNILVESIY
ncbi:unnamed protein product [Victoria cruziana]